MAAATANRKATRLGDPKFSYVDERTVINADKIYVGTMVQADDTTGEVAPATDAAAKAVLGVSTQYIDNTDDGEKIDDISTAIHLMNNSGTSALAKADIGSICYVEDDNTVAKVTTNSNPAGVVVEVTSDGVFVDFDPAKKA